MRPDELWLAEDGNFTLVTPKGRLARFASYTAGVLELLAGPALMVVVGAVGEFEWPTLVGGVAVIVLVGGFGLASIVSTARMQRRVVRLAQHGRPATAEVMAPRSVALGEETGVEVTLRISGPDVPAFQTTRRGTPGRIDRLGASFPVIVDPADSAYMIMR